MKALHTFSLHFTATTIIDGSIKFLSALINEAVETCEDKTLLASYWQRWVLKLAVSLKIRLFYLVLRSATINSFKKKTLIMTIDVNAFTILFLCVQMFFLHFFSIHDEVQTVYYPILGK